MSLVIYYQFCASHPLQDSQKNPYHKVPYPYNGWDYARCHVKMLIGVSSNNRTPQKTWLNASLFIHIKLFVAVQQPWRTGLPERGAGHEEGQAREKDEAKPQVSDQGSKFKFQLCVYIGKTHRSILCFSWIILQSKLSGQSVPVGNCNST